eukprot:15399_1
MSPSLADGLAHGFKNVIVGLEARAELNWRLLSLAALVANPSTSSAMDLEKMQSLEAAVFELEARCDAVCSSLEAEERESEQLQEMLKAAIKSSEGIEYMMKNLPAQLPGDAMVEKAKRWREEQERQAHDASIRGAQVCKDIRSGGDVGHNKQNHAAVPSPLTLSLITVMELESVPKTTRGRVQLAQLNAAVQEIQSMMGKKQDLLSRPKSKLNDKQRRQKAEILEYMPPGQEGAPFLTEAEIRGSCRSVGCKGEATARCILVTLRHLKRLKQVRVGPMTIYVRIPSE